MGVDLDRTTTGEHTLDARGPLVVGNDTDDAGLARGQTIGRYVALRRLGSGGMGVVWSAWDPELDREVAIKLLRRLAEGHSRGRLLREAQAMARVAHPNIVAVHDVGVVDGRVFVAMEYVRGQTLRVWQAEQSPPWPAIVDAYRQAARGLGAAHRAGLVHRDFKPDNAMIDASGRVRVMDFGLAAAHGGGPDSLGDSGSGSGSPESGERSRPADVPIERSSDLLSAPLTEVGALVGTPGYMAPEQFDGGRGGPAADQFALCVALWQALYRERPFPGETLHELMAAVSLGRLRDAPDEVELPAKLHAALVRGLQTEPGERWPSLEALDQALDLRERGGSRAGWWVAAALVVGGLIGFGWWSQADDHGRCDAAASPLAERWSSQERLRVATALREAGPHGDGVWTRVEPAIDAWVAEWEAVASAACNQDDGLPEPLRIAQAVCLDRQVRAFTADLALLDQADAEIAARAIDMIAELPSPEACANPEALAALDRRPAPRDPQLAKQLRETLTAAEAAREAGRYREAAAMLEDARSAADALGDRVTRGELLASLGWIQYERSETTQAVASLTEGYQELVREGEDEAAAQVAIDLIAAHARLAEPELARAWDIHAEALIDRVYGAGAAGTGSAAAVTLRADRLVALAATSEGAGQLREALELYQSAAALLEAEFGPESLALARVLDEVGAVHSRLGQLDAAERSEQRSLELLRAGLGPAHPEVGTTHFNLGNTAYRRGDLEGARTHYEQTLAIVEPALGREHGAVTGALIGLGAIALGEGNDVEAAANFRAALVRSEARVGPDHPDLVAPLVNLGIALKRGGDYAGAEAAQLRALALLEAQYGDQHPDLLAVLDNLGELRSLAGDHDGAIEAYTRSLAIGEQAFGRGHPELDYALIGLGEAELARGEAELARAWFERVLADTKVEGKHQGLVAVAEFGLARVLAAEGRRADAIAGAERARERLSGQSNPDAGDLARIDAWLREMAG